MIFIMLLSKYAFYIAHRLAASNIYDEQEISLGFLNDVNVERRVLLLLQRLEVGKDRVVSTRPEGLLQKMGEVPQLVRVIGESEMAARGDIITRYLTDR